MQPGNYPPAGMADPFQDPRAYGEPGPAMQELAGRTVIFTVKEYDPSAEYEGQPRPSAKVDVYVVDGGPLNYGGSYSQNDPRPPTHTIATPCLFTDRMYSGVNITSALRDHAPVVLNDKGQRAQGRGNGGPVIGVVERSSFGKHPWNLTRLDPKDETRGAEFLARRGAAGQFWGAVVAGAFTNPEGQPIPGVGGPQYGANPYASAAPAQAAPYGAWPQGAQPAQQYQAPTYPPVAQPAPYGGGFQGATPVGVNPQNPAQTVYQQAPAAPVAPPAQGPYGDPNAAWNPAAAAPVGQGQAPPLTYAQVPPQAPQAYVPAQAGPPAVEQGPPAPAGYEQLWPTIDLGMKMQIIAKLAEQAGQAAQAGPRTNPW